MQARASDHDSELLDALRAGGDLDVIREALAADTAGRRRPAAA